jgi:hypothetical protein
VTGGARGEKGRRQAGTGAEQGRAAGASGKTGAGGRAGKGAAGFGPGRGKGLDAGTSSTNLEQAGGPEKKIPFKGRLSRDRSRRLRTYHKIYAPKEVAVGTEEKTAAFKVGKAPPAGSVQVKGRAGKGEEAYIPFSDLPPDYRKAAEDALEKQVIPREYRKLIREYFDDFKK